MIHYITKVDKHHILEVNGESISVEQRILNSVQEQRISNSVQVLEYKGVTVFPDFTISAYNKPFTSIVVAVEVARVVLKQGDLK